MKVLVTGKYCPDLKDPVLEMPGDSFVIASDIEGVIEALHNLNTKSLVIIFDDEPDSFYALLGKIKEMTQRVKLILVYPDDKCFIIGDNESNSAIIYHLPVNTNESVIE